MRMTNSSSPLPTWHDHAAGSVRAAHRPLPRLPERFGLSMTVYRTLPWPSTSVELHLLLLGAGCRHLFLALHIRHRALADGMVGQLYVRPRQNRVPVNGSLYARSSNSKTIAHGLQFRHRYLAAIPCQSLRIRCLAQQRKYAYNDGDGSTYYDVEYPLQSTASTPVSILSA